MPTALYRARGSVPFLFISFFFSSRRRHTRLQGDWSSDVCSSDLRLAGPDPSERPCGVAAHQRVAVIGKSAEQFRYRIWIPQVPQGDRDVPPEAAAPCALDRRAAEPALELLLGDVEQGEE